MYLHLYKATEVDSKQNLYKGFRIWRILWRCAEQKVYVEQHHDRIRSEIERTGGAPDEAAIDRIAFRELYDEKTPDSVDIDELRKAVKIIWAEELKKYRAEREVNANKTQKEKRRARREKLRKGSNV